jgi:pyruvate/2-oxoacid:ferredoxin oxidoreductase beta subunit
MGCEFAHFIEWKYDDQLDWFLLLYDRHPQVLACVKALNKLYRETPALYEVEDGTYRLTTKVHAKKPLEEFLKPQGRFKHLFKPGNEALLAELQADVDRNWERLLKRCEG